MRHRAGRWLAPLVVTAAAVLGVVGAPSAWAGGANLHPVQDRYEPGQEATFVGYVVPAARSGWLENGPFFGFVQAPAAVLPLGQVALQPVPAVGPNVVRVQSTFRVPDDLEAGHYELFFCDDPCVMSIGDLAGGTLNVGVDPVQPIVREWPPSEPELANVAAGTRIETRSFGEPPTVTTAAPAPPRTIPVQVELKPEPDPVPAREAAGSSVELGPLVVGAAIALACLGFVLAALRDS